MLSPWLEKCTKTFLTNPLQSVLSDCGSYLFVLTVDEGGSILTLADSQYTICGVLSSEYKTKQNENIVDPSQTLQFGLILPKSFLFAKATILQEDGTFIDSFVMRLLDIDIIEYGPNRSYQGTQIEVDSLLEVRNVIYQAPYGILGFFNITPPQRKDDLDDNTLDYLLNDSPEIELDCGVSSLFVGDDSSDIDLLKNEMEEISQNVTIPKIVEVIRNSQDDVIFQENRDRILSKLGDSLFHLPESTQSTPESEQNLGLSNQIYFQTQQDSNVDCQLEMNESHLYHNSVKSVKALSQHDEIFQMTQPSDITMNTRIKEHVKSSKRNKQTQQLSAYGIELYSFKRLWTSRWIEDHVV